MDTSEGTGPQNNAAASSSSPTTASGETQTQIQPFRMPTVEEMQAQEVWNNWVLRIVVSVVMGGPRAACAGFAAFSVLIEKFLDRQS